MGYIFLKMFEQLGGTTGFFSKPETLQVSKIPPPKLSSLAANLEHTTVHCSLTD